MLGLLGAIALVLPTGLEPVRRCRQQILSLQRLPFRHRSIDCSVKTGAYYRGFSKNFQVGMVEGYKKKADMGESMPASKG